MVRQLNRRVPSGAQLPQRLRWLPMNTRDLSPTPIRGHQRSIPAAMCSAAWARYHAAKALQDAFAAYIFFESGAHGDLKLTLVEADLGRRSRSVLDDHLDVASEVGQGLAGEEASGERLFRQLGHSFDDPRGAVEHDVPNLVVGGPGGGGHEDSLGCQPDLDGLLAPRAASHFVGDGGAVEGNLASAPRGEPSVISFVAWRLLQFSEDYKALAISGLVARPENRTTPSFSARGATPSIAPLHEVPRMILTPSTLVSLL